MTPLGKILTGIVISDKMQGTIVVENSTTSRHPKYQKVFAHQTRFYADNNLKAKIGDTVKIQETRPLSKLKRFTTLAIISQA